MTALYSLPVDQSYESAFMVGPSYSVEFHRLTDIYVSYFDRTGVLQHALVTKAPAILWGTTTNTNLDTTANNYVAFFLHAEQSNAKLYAIPEKDYRALEPTVDLVPLYYLLHRDWQPFQIRNQKPITPASIITAVLSDTTSEWNTQINSAFNTFNFFLRSPLDVPPGAPEPEDDYFVRNPHTYYYYFMRAGFNQDLTLNSVPSSKTQIHTNVLNYKLIYHVGTNYGLDFFDLYPEAHFLPVSSDSSVLAWNVFEVSSPTDTGLGRWIGLTVEDGNSLPYSHRIIDLHDWLPPDNPQVPGDLQIPSNTPLGLHFAGAGLPIMYNAGKRDTLAPRTYLSYLEPTIQLDVLEPQPPIIPRFPDQELSPDLRLINGILPYLYTGKGASIPTALYGPKAFTVGFSQNQVAALGNLAIQANGGNSQGGIASINLHTGNYAVNASDTCFYYLRNLAESGSFLHTDIPFVYRQLGFSDIVLFKRTFDPVHNTFTSGENVVEYAVQNAHLDSNNNPKVGWIFPIKGGAVNSLIDPLRSLTGDPILFQVDKGILWKTPYETNVHRAGADPNTSAPAGEISYSILQGYSPAPNDGIPLINHPSTLYNYVSYPSARNLTFYGGFNPHHFSNSAAGSTIGEYIAPIPANSHTVINNFNGMPGVDRGPYMEHENFVLSEPELLNAGGIIPDRVYGDYHSRFSGSAGYSNIHFGTGGAVNTGFYLVYDSTSTVVGLHFIGEFEVLFDTGYVAFHHDILVGITIFTQEPIQPPLFIPLPGDWASFVDGTGTYNFIVYANKNGTMTINSGDMQVFSGKIHPRKTTWTFQDENDGYISNALMAYPCDAGGKPTNILGAVPTGDGATFPWGELSTFIYDGSKARIAWEEKFDAITGGDRGLGTFPRPGIYGISMRDFGEYFNTDYWQYIYSAYITTEFDTRKGFYLYFKTFNPTQKIWYKPTLLFNTNDPLMDISHNIPPGTNIHFKDPFNQSARYFQQLGGITGGGGPFPGAVFDMLLDDGRGVSLSPLTLMMPLAFPIAVPIYSYHDTKCPFINSINEDIHLMHTMATPIAVDDIPGGLTISGTPNTAFTALMFKIDIVQSGYFDGTGRQDLPKRKFSITGFQDRFGNPQPVFATHNPILQYLDWTLSLQYVPIYDRGLPHWQQGYWEQIENFGPTVLAQFEAGYSQGSYSINPFRPEYSLRWYTAPSLEIHPITSTMLTPPDTTVLGVSPNGSYIKLNNYSESINHRYGTYSPYRDTGGIPVPLKWILRNNGKDYDLSSFSAQLSTTCGLYTQSGAPNYSTYPFARIPSPGEAAYPYNSMTNPGWKDIPVSENFQYLYQCTTTDPNLSDFSGNHINAGSTQLGWLAFNTDVSLPFLSSSYLPIRFSGNPQYSAIMVGTGQVGEPTTMIIDDNGEIEVKAVLGVAYDSGKNLFAIDASTGNLIIRPGPLGTAWSVKQTSFIPAHDTVLLLHINGSTITCIHGTNNMVTETISTNGIITNGTPFPTNTLVQNDPSRWKWPTLATAAKSYV